MKKIGKPGLKWFAAAALAAIGVAVAVSVPAGAAPVALSDWNSQVIIDPNAGITDWVVDGVDHMTQEWFWYRVDSPAGAGTRETALIRPVSQSNTANYAQFTYVADGLQFDLQFLLTGGSERSYNSDIAESVRVKNISQDVRKLNLFEYTNLDLTAGAADDMGQFVNGNTIRQWDNITESIVAAAPIPAAWEIGLNPSILAKLNDAKADNLANSAPMVGPGDVEWAFQWTATLKPGQTFLMSKDKLIQLVPEPGSLVALGTGLAGLTGLLRKRRSA